MNPTNGPVATRPESLRTLLVDVGRARELRLESRDWPSIALTRPQLADLELLLNGAFAPLDGFLGRSDYESVCESMRLADGRLWPMPVTLDVNESTARTFTPGQTVALRDAEGVMLAALRVEDVWRPDRALEARAIFGTANREHPGVDGLLDRNDHCLVSGVLEGVELPRHYDFRALRVTPEDARKAFDRRGWRAVAAFHTTGVMHRAQYELTLHAAAAAGAKLLIHPVVDSAGDRDHYTRVRCYQALLPHYPADTAVLGILELAARRGSPRDALWHAMIRRNFGCSHFILARPSATSPGDVDVDAQERLLRAHEQEVGISVLPGTVLEGLRDADVQRLLNDGRELPVSFTFPEVARELQRAHRPRRSQGFTVFLTGLSGAGKSTIANIVAVKLSEAGGRGVTLLDGDIVRRNLSSELGFSKEHRDLNIRRIAFVASEITKNGGVAICAPIAPYDAVRKEARASISQVGTFVLVHLSTPLAICELRDRKGLYARARKGLLPHFTGISDPYEAPDDADVTIDTSDVSPEDAALQVLRFLAGQGLVAL